MENVCIRDDGTFHELEAYFDENMNVFEKCTKCNYSYSYFFDSKDKSN